MLPSSTSTLWREGMTPLDWPYYGSRCLNVKLFLVAFDVTVTVPRAGSGPSDLIWFI